MPWLARPSGSFRPGHQRTADRQHLLLSAGKVARKAAPLFQRREIRDDHVNVITRRAAGPAVGDAEVHPLTQTKALARSGRVMKPFNCLVR